MDQPEADRARGDSSRRSVQQMARDPPPVLHVPFISTSRFIASLIPTSWNDNYHQDFFKIRNLKFIIPKKKKNPTKQKEIEMIISVT